MLVVVVDDDDREVRILARDRVGASRDVDRRRRSRRGRARSRTAAVALQRSLVLVGGEDPQALRCLSACHPASSVRPGITPSASVPRATRAASASLRRPTPGAPPCAQRARVPDRLRACSCSTTGPGAAPGRAREDRELFERYRDGDRLAREQLVERFLPLARQLARRYQRAERAARRPLQVASLGLIKAIDRFDPEREIAFSSYAVPTILGEIKRHFRDRTWSVRVPRDLQELALQGRQGRRRARREDLHRQPSVREIGAAVGADEEQVLEALQAGGAYRAMSFDAPRGTGGEDEATTLADSVGVDERRLRPRRGPRDARAPADDRDAARARGAAPALRGGHDAGRDRRASSA